MVFCSSSKSARWYWPADKITHSRLSASGALDPSLDLIVILEFHESPMHGRLHHNAFHLTIIMLRRHEVDSPHSSVFSSSAASFPASSSFLALPSARSFSQTATFAL